MTQTAEPNRRWTDVQSLRFTPQIVAVIVSGFLAVSGGMWASTYGLRSDVRDILTRMEGQAKIEEMNAKLQEQSAMTLRESIESVKRRQELQQYEIQGLKEIVLQLKGRSQ